MELKLDELLVEETSKYLLEDYKNILSFKYTIKIDKQSTNHLN